MIDTLATKGTTGTYGKADFDRVDAALRGDNFSVENRTVLVIGSQVMECGASPRSRASPFTYYRKNKCVRMYASTDMACRATSEMTYLQRGLSIKQLCLNDKIQFTCK